MRNGAVMLVIAALAGLAAAVVDRPAPLQIGVTFSTAYANELGEDPEAAFRAVVSELGVRRIRLPVYWSEVEGERDAPDFAAYDRLVRLAEERGVALTLAIGAKVPRWPECFVPDWAAGLPKDAFREELFSFLRETVERYRGSPAVERWQVENEALFPFGVCPKPDLPRLLDEVALVRSLDLRPIQATASGELESWALPAIPADILGVSMYRTTWNDWYGYFRYPIPPWFYRLRSALVSPLVRETVISELQAEPWFNGPVASRPLAYWAKAFTPHDLKENVAFAARTGMGEAYLWGAEWWYHLRQNGLPELWDTAKTFFR
ncbi:hypothetical protein EPO34_00240 [Patescibacteria group bacterium]|nr:MAG: hypothetical protein EPO34_00240 [Patescibacteria group bacterium]